MHFPAVPEPKSARIAFSSCSCSDPRARSDPIGGSETKPGDARLILFIYLLFKFSFSKMSRLESPAQPVWRIRTGARFTQTFPFILSKHLFMSFHFRVFNYAEAFSNGRPINIYSYTIHLQNGLSCLYKMIHKNNGSEFNSFVHKISHVQKI